MPFCIGAGALVLGIVILSTAHGLLNEAEKAQAEQVTAADPAPDPALVPVEHDAAAKGAIVAAVDGSPDAERVTEAAARLAAINGRTVHVVRAEESAVAGGAAAVAEDPEAGRTAVRKHLDRLTALGVPAVGHVLRNATGDGEAGRMVAEHAERTGARAIVVGAPVHGGLSALMDAGAGRALMRYATCDVVLINPRSADVGAAA